MSDKEPVACEACDAGARPLRDEEISEKLKTLDGWELQKRGDIPTLTRSWKFADFATALAFTNRVGELAEQEGHHPEILTEWGGVRVTWWSHSIKGLHSKDFEMAAACDPLASSQGKD